MLGFMCGVFFGGVAGFFLCALFVVSKEERK